MEEKIRRIRSARNLVKYLQYREQNSEVDRAIKQRFQFSDNFVKRLGFEKELEGHQGCVNCIEWSPNGTILASGSDDTKVILWDVFQHKLLKTIPTPHNGNIFSVKFLADEHTIATGAGDFKVVVQNVEGAMSGAAPLLHCICHISRVKRLATCPDQPTLFWSASEDGLVYQYDMREPHDCYMNVKLLLNLSKFLELKCIAVNPTKPHYIAIGANDCFVRLYDRRMLKVMVGRGFGAMSSCNNLDVNCVQYYSPGHLVKKYADTVDCKVAVTYISFNVAGSEMLVNVGGEQIYLFDVNNRKPVKELEVAHHLPKIRRTQKTCKNCGPSEDDNGNPLENCACFYMKRAFKYYDRLWVSDLYSAARDYLHVIQHWPNQKQAYIGLIKCMIALKWAPEAGDWLKYFLKLNPEFENNSQIRILKKDLKMLQKIPRTENDDDKSSNKYTKKIDDEEREWRLDSCDFSSRYMGHCNTTTDIKEASFLGENDNYICAGSDEGIIFIWDRKSTEIVRALAGDSSIVNCIQPHPSACLLATSGIDPTVKIWSPLPEEGDINDKLVQDLSPIIEANQHRMRMHPCETMLATLEDLPQQCRTS